MASPFQQYNSGIQPVSGIAEAGSNIGKFAQQGLSSLGQSLSEGLQKYNQNSAENEMIDQKTKALGNQIMQFESIYGQNPEYAKFGELLKKQAEALANIPSMSLAAKRGAYNGAEVAFSQIGAQLQAFNQVKTEKDNKEIATIGLNDAEKNLTALAGQLKDDISNKPLYDSVQARLQELQNVKSKPTAAQGAFLTTTAGFLKGIPESLAIGEKLGNNVGLQRVNTALNEVNATRNTKLSPVEIEGLSKYYDAGKTAYDNHIAIDGLLNQFRQTHNIPISNSKIVSQLFSAIQDSAKATGTPQGSALAESLSNYLSAIPQNLNEEGNVPAGSSYTTTDKSVPANTDVTPENSKKLADSLEIPPVGVYETKQVELTDDERKAAVLAKVSREYGDVSPALFQQWYATIVPPKPSVSIGKIGDATVVTTTDTKGNIKVTNIPQPQQKTPDVFKTEKDKSDYNGTTFGKLNPKTEIKEYKDSEGNPIWEDVGKDAPLQISGRMSNVNDEQAKLFRQQKVAFSEIMTQTKALRELKKHYSVLASKGQAPDDSEQEKRIKTETAILKSRIQRVLYPVGQPREWENKVIEDALPKLTDLFTYDTTQIGGLDQLEIRLKNSIEEDAKGYGLLVRDKPKADAQPTKEQIDELAKQIAIEAKVKGQIRK